MQTNAAKKVTNNKAFIMGKLPGLREKRIAES
jgi:hypothetical protein